MKVIILAGGFGTRISEETIKRPKPMVNIGNKPILWHIMKTYSAYGLNEFVICCGYKGYMIKEYFANYFLHTSDVTFHMEDNRMEVHRRKAEPWKVTLLDTGEKTLTGGRLKKAIEFIDEQNCCFTYGDGLCDVNISNLIEYHKQNGKLATLTAVQPPGRFGSLKLDSPKKDQILVKSFQEKPEGDGGWINGGYFVLESTVAERIKDDQTIWEQEPMCSLGKDNELAAFLHRGFWQPMDTLRDMHYLERLWESNNAPWRKW